MSKPQALVLLGVSGSGKDTLVKLAQARFKGVGNIKFGQFNKELVANVLSVPVLALEDKEWRVNHNILQTEFGYTGSYHLSPLDLLSVLFVGGTSETSVGNHYRKCYQDYTITKALKYDSPVFTDIRHFSEIDAVQEVFDTTVVFIQTPWLKQGVNDTYILDIAKACQAEVLVRTQQETPIDTFTKLLTLTTTKEEDTCTKLY